MNFSHKNEESIFCNKVNFPLLFWRAKLTIFNWFQFFCLNWIDVKTTILFFLSLSLTKPIRMILYFLWKSITLSKSEGIFFLKWFLHAARKSLAAKIFKFVFCSPCESSPSLTKFIIIYLVFSILVDYFFQVSLQIKLNFERGKKGKLTMSGLNSFKYHELKYRNCVGKLV